MGEMRAALLSAVAKRVGIEKAREADPWFFPDEEWMKQVLGEAGFEVEKMELEYRPTKATEGSGKGSGVEGWVRLMGKQFLDVLGEEREEVVREVCEVLESVCARPGGGYLIGYVRLRILACKV